MKLRNKKTGKIGEPRVSYQEIYVDTTEHNTYCYKSIAGLNEDWEDYKPAEPVFDEKIRKAIRAWWDMQGNPFKSAHVMLISKNKDLDESYHWKIFGYIRSGKEKTSTDMEFRTKKLYDYKPHHEYMKEELCGEEEE